MPLSVRSNPVADVLPIVLVAVGGLYLLSALGKTASAAPGGPGSGGGAPGGSGGSAGSGGGLGGGDRWWLTEPMFGPDAVAVWLRLQDASGQPVYARGTTVYSSAETVIPPGTQLVQRTGLLGLDRTYWIHNGDGTFTSATDGATYAIDQFYAGPKR